MRVLLLILGLASCDVDTGGEHEVEISDSVQTIDVRTSFDRILEICELILPSGGVVPYRSWSDQQRECVEVLDVDPTIFDQLPEDFNLIGGNADE